MKSLKEYRRIDLFFLMLLAVMAEAGSCFGYQLVGSQFYLSIALVVLMVALCRWQAWGLVIYLPVLVLRVAFAPYLELSNRLIIYSGEALLLLVSPVWFTLLKRVKWLDSGPLVAGFAFWVWFLAALGRSIGIIICDASIRSWYQGFSQSLLELVIIVLTLLLLSRAAKMLLVDVKQQVRPQASEV